MEIRSTHWMAALVLSVAIHTFLVQFVYTPGGTGTTGGEGISVRLGTHAAFTEAVEALVEAQNSESEPLLASETRPVPPTEPALSSLIPTSLDAASPQWDTRDSDIELVVEPMVGFSETESVKVDVVTLTNPSLVNTRARTVTLEQVSPNPVSEVVPQDLATAREPTATAATTPTVSDSGTGSLTSGPPGTSDTGRSGLVQDYYAELAMWLGRHKRYPRRARRNGLEGTVEVEFAIDKKGRLLNHHIVGSSGFELLDEEAIALIERAAPMPPIPNDLGFDRLTITAPISFFLR